MKLGLFSLLVAALLASSIAMPTLAAPIGAPAVGPTVFVGDTTVVSASWDSDEQGPATLRATVDIGVFISASATGGNDLGLISGIGSHQLTIQDDVDNLLEGETSVNAVFKCTSSGTTAFVLTHDSTTSNLSVTLSCVNPGSQPPGDTNSQASQGVIPGVGQVVLTAFPNILPCEGGTTTLEAEVVNTSGVVVGGYEFRFHTTAGTLVQTSRDTARLSLGANQTSATVTATIFDPTGQASNVRASVPVSLACNDSNADQTLVVTASPNVVNCTGTTTITATVRDRNGHVVPGRGFHFVTSTGLLVVAPNDANSEEGIATLTLRPGDGDATVIATSGRLFGTYEEHDEVESNFADAETGFVTVRQNCLSTTTGQIRVNSSATNVVCGENVFIGLHVIDEDIQTVVDDTPITLIASAGGFYGGVIDGGQTILPAAQVPTRNGEANTIYTAPANFNGEVRITAASGDVFGTTRLNVSCVTLAPTGTGTSAASPRPCTPIGDGICITPPNTGRNQITPPSTGSAGLR